MAILRYDHVQLAIPPGGEAAARRFYGELLGFTEVPKPEAMRVRGGMWFEAGGVALHLGLEEGMRPSVKMHPALVVSELDALVARLAGAGFEWKPTDELAGSIAGSLVGRSSGLGELAGIRRGHTRDPFGNRIELIEGQPT